MTQLHELPETVDIFVHPRKLNSEIHPKLRQNLAVEARAYGRTGFMPKCENGEVTRFTTQRLRGFGEHTLTRMLQLLPRGAAGNDSYLETVAKHKAVGYGYDSEGNEIMFIMGKLSEGGYLVLELINGIDYFAFKIEAPSEYQYYPSVFGIVEEDNI